MGRLAQFVGVLLPSLIEGAEGAAVDIGWTDDGGLVVDAERGDWLLTVTAAAGAERVYFRTVGPGECVTGIVEDWAAGSRALAAWLDDGDLKERGLLIDRGAA